MSYLPPPRSVLVCGGAALGLALAAGLTAAPSALADDNASVSVLHGVPGATVDVWANGEPLLTDFAPGTLTDPVSLPAGDYDLRVVAAGGGADAEAIMEANDVAVPAGANITVAAHLTQGGEPTLTPFVNDTSATPAGQGHLTVRHIAAAPAVDVRADGEVAFEALTNPNGVNAALPTGTISADVVLAGTNDVALGPADVEIRSGVNTIVYAWGSAADDNLALAVQTVQVNGGAPGGVPAGDGGQAAAATNTAMVAVTLGGAVLAAGGVMLVLRRREAARR